ETAVKFIRETVVFCASCGEAQDGRRLAPGAPCPRCGGKLGVPRPTAAYSRAKITSAITLTDETAEAPTIRGMPDQLFASGAAPPESRPGLQPMTPAPPPNAFGHVELSTDELAIIGGPLTPKPFVQDEPDSATTLASPPEPEPEPAAEA